MHTTVQLIEQLKDTHGLPSDYAVAKLLGISTQRISNYRNRSDTLGADLAIEVADQLGLDRGYVLACMAAERAKRTDEKRAWEALARRASHAAIFLLCLGVTSFFGWDLSTVAQAASVFYVDTHYAHSGIAAAFALGLILRIVLRRP